MPRPESLERLIRASPALDEDGKREWLRILPHLKATDRDRLRQVLIEVPAVSGVDRPRSGP